MLTCIACSKQLNGINGGSNHKKEQEEEEEDDTVISTLRSKQAIKSLTSQIKDMAIKASGAYKNCKPCSGSSNRNYTDSDIASGSRSFHCAYQRAGSLSSAPRIWGKEMETRLKGISSGEATPASMSVRTESSIVFMEEDEPKEWVAQVEPGVLITFVSLPHGGNDLKRIRFSVEMFNKREAQRWWAENYDKVMELYNVRQLNQQSVPFPSPPRSQDESSQVQSAMDSPATPPLNKERPRSNTVPSLPSPGPLIRDRTQTRQHHGSSTGLASSSRGTKTETSSAEGSVRSSSSREGDVGCSSASDMETEWVEQDEPGVYITIRALPDGSRELRRVRFSRERFGETDARLWWDQNRARIQHHYL